MQAIDTPRYKLGQAELSALEREVSEKQLRRLLSDLISSSSDLNIRVWLDGVYTNMEDARPTGDWMNGREVYFKVEGRVQGMRDAIPRGPGGS